MEVTWPNAKMISEIDEENLLFLHLCALWSTLPFAVMGVSLLEVLVRRGTREINFFGFVCFVVLLNELVFKQIAFQMRPERSCLVSCGMPSGHSAMAMGLLTLCLLDLVRRVNYRPAPLRISRARLCALPRVLFGELSLLFSLAREPAWDELSHFTALFSALMWSVILYPVPLSRIALHDHTPEQVVAGSFLGFGEACLWWYFIQSLQHRCNHMLGAKIGVCGKTLLIHNFALPRFIAEQRVAGKNTVDGDRELQWYHARTVERLATLDTFQDADGSVRGRRVKEERKHLLQREHQLVSLRSSSCSSALA